MTRQKIGFIILVGILATAAIADAFSFQEFICDIRGGTWINGSCSFEDQDTLKAEASRDFHIYEGPIPKIIEVSGLPEGW